MNFIKRFTVIMLVIFISTNLNFAQDDPEFSYRIGGTIQAWTSLGQIDGSDTSSLGWGLRRVRVRAYSNFGTKMKGFVQFELTSLNYLMPELNIYFLICLQ
ncbi:MAG: hypothetical protein H6613_15265 [Ignavibacteriales bacterium]|nr:hypothetical protein [Ignavibacteriales bacterium]